MELRRTPGLPPYVFAEIDQLKLDAIRDGNDIVDLGFGNPDIPSPQAAVDTLCAAAQDPENHRYSMSRGIQQVRQAISDLYLRRFGVQLDPEREVVTTIGAKEGFAHLMWVLLAPGDAALVPTPSYPIHYYAPLFAGANVQTVEVENIDGDEVATGEAFFAQVEEAWLAASPKPRVIILSFPHNPTTACIDLKTMTKLVNFAHDHDLVLVHDFAYSDTAFDGYEPPSILQVPGAREVAVEIYTMTKSFSMAGWRIGFVLGNAEMVQGLTKLKSYLDYGTFQPIQLAAIAAMNDASQYPKAVTEIYRARRDALCDGLSGIGWDVAKPKGTMFVWAKIPEAYRYMGSHEFAKFLIKEGKVATSPGHGFGAGGDDFVRFALIGDEARIAQGVENLRVALKL